jgi:hypothetical protein
MLSAYLTKTYIYIPGYHACIHPTSGNLQPRSPRRSSPPRSRPTLILRKAPGRRSRSEDKLDLVALAKLSNHSYHTFNHTYTGTTTLTISTLLHRSYRVSESWRTFFRLDHLLQSKWPRGASEALAASQVEDKAVINRNSSRVY